MIAGTYKGRVLQTPPGRSTRPTGDRVKEAIFSMIGPYFSQQSCLDVFAGSGALGIEALSRGVQRAVFVDKASGSVIHNNLASLNASDRAVVIRSTYKQAFDRLKEQGEVFDLVFADPPYQAQLLDKCLHSLVELSLLAPFSLVVAEMPSELATPVVPRLTLWKEAVYGIAKIGIYRFT